MKHSKAEIEEARRRAKQTEVQVTSQMEMIESMKRSSISTDIAEEALRTMRKIMDQMHARLRSMTVRYLVD